MTTSFTYCCEKCLESIARKSPSIARKWLDLCYLQNNQSKIVYAEEDEALTFLEKLGFIVSLETHNSIEFKVLGQENVDGEVFFCVENHYE